MIKLDAYKDRVVAVFGLGKAGMATIESLAAAGAKVVAWDDRAESREKLKEMNLDVRIKKIEKWPWEHLSIIVLSPGIPLNYPTPHKVVQEARQHCCPIVGDIELLYQAQPHACYVTITGTNGKSTTTALVGHILKEAGRRVEVGGNIGTAALSLEPLQQNEIYVLELSSYQLDLLATTRFDISVLLNISYDHIDRHGSMEGYVHAKTHIFDRQTQHDHAVILLDDEYTKQVCNETARMPVHIHTGSTTGEPANICVENGILIDGEVRIDLNPLQRLQGKHNWQNALAAYHVAKILDIPAGQIEKALHSFPGLEHRMEYVCEMNGVTFINDSKATNANAASYALQAYDNLFWIAGGVSKEGGITTLEPYFDKITRAYLIGQSEREYSETLAGKVIYTKCGTLEKALEKIMEDVKQSGLETATVMFSPASASFDQFKNFEQRGEHFKQLVHKLSEGECR